MFPRNVWQNGTWQHAWPWPLVAGYSFFITIGTFGTFGTHCYLYKSPSEKVERSPRQPFN